MSIFISKKSRDAVKLDQQDFAKENFLQDYVHNNPETIPVYEIDEDKKLFVAAREFGTESGPIDALAIDKDGDIYIVETKLQKNYTRREVVAQALDYGAALWRHSDYSDFIARINSEVNKTFKISFEEKIKDFFGIDDEQSSAVLEALRNNLQQGNIKFVILMDAVDDRLKDLIVYINQTSRFDIFAVQFQYYKHEDYEIIVPKLFGAEVRKDVPTNFSGSQRTKWDEQSYFEDAKKHLPTDQVALIKKLYDFAKQKSEISWGTGVNGGSFSAQFMQLGTKPLFVLKSNGVLQISFDYPKKDATASQIAKLNELELLTSQAGFIVNKGTNRTIFKIDEWAPQAETLISNLTSSII